MVGTLVGPMVQWLMSRQSETVRSLCVLPIVACVRRDARDACTGNIVTTIPLCRRSNTDVVFFENIQNGPCFCGQSSGNLE